MCSNYTMGINMANCQNCGKAVRKTGKARRTPKYCKECGPIVTKDKQRIRNKNRVRNKEKEKKYNKEVRLPRLLKKVQEQGFKNLHEYSYARQAWANEVKARDGLCLECGSEFNLEAHHIISVAEDPTKTFDLKNGETLCIYCHRINSNSRHSKK